MWLIYTNVLSALRRPERARQVATWIRARNPEDLYLSVVTLGEIERGICQQEGRNPGCSTDLRAWIDRTELLCADRILPFDTAAARLSGQLSADPGHPGADLMIAATALVRGATVVTGNVDDFAPTGVPVLNPFDGC
jgi:hypothetical protein